MFDCDRQVEYLQEDRNTINTNAENYGYGLTIIIILCIPGDNRDFLQRFQDWAENNYQRQIEIDLNYLIASQDLFQQSISAVGGDGGNLPGGIGTGTRRRGKKRDRQPENIIFFV
ncbi:hypothetical protein [Microcoleus sp. F4-D5]|uniref:hypothetical protein n=1 Tax=Microcoleus sp. F4-D5 TaxID=2818760 RepID=UPI002FD726B4